MSSVAAAAGGLQLAVRGCSIHAPAPGAFRCAERTCSLSPGVLSSVFTSVVLPAGATKCHLQQVKAVTRQRRPSVGAQLLFAAHLLLEARNDHGSAQPTAWLSVFAVLSAGSKCNGTNTTALEHAGSTAGRT